MGHKLTIGVCILCAFLRVHIVVKGKPKSAANILVDHSNWIVAATGTNIPGLQQPMYNSCVTLNVEFTKWNTSCIYLHYENRFHRMHILKVHGKDRKKVTQIYSLAPVHAWNPNHTTDLYTRRGTNTTYNATTVIKQPFCWNPRTFRVRQNRFFVTQVDSATEDWLLLVGLHPLLLTSGSEYHCAILTKHMKPKDKVVKMMEKVKEFNTLYKTVARCPRLKLACISCGEGEGVDFTPHLG